MTGYVLEDRGSIPGGD